MSHKNLNVKNKIPKLFKDKINNKKINQIYRKFEKSFPIKSNFIVGVSGGPDSLALAFLTKIYSLKNNLYSNYFIIDHKLRKESTYEAKIVKKLLKKNSIKAKILSWNGRKPKKNIQAIARNNRYKLLFKESDKLKVKDIVLGHHQDDLIENFFIRLLRGSGLKGLISLNKKVNVGDKNLLRPLLDFRKEDLTFVTNHIFNFYVKDRSNEDKKFQRIRIRKLIQELQKDGLDKIKLKKTIDNLQYADSVVNFYVNQNLQKNSFFSNNKDNFVVNKKFFQQPREVVFRSFSEIIKLVGKKFYFVRGKKLDKVLKNIEKNRLYRVTLGGCIIEKVNQTVIVSKEH